MKAIIANWIQALRSGKYKQATAALYAKHSDCYCALGVLADVAGMERHPTNRRFTSDAIYADLHALIGGDYTKSIEGIYELNDGIRSEVNPSGRKHSFLEIADKIENGLLDDREDKLIEE